MEDRYTARKGDEVEARLTFRLKIKADEDITDENLEELIAIAFTHAYSSYKLGFKGIDDAEAHLSCVEIDPYERRLHYLDRTKY